MWTQVRKGLIQSCAAVLVIGLVEPAAASSGKTSLGKETTLEWYGYFRFDMAHDSAESSHGNYILYVKPHDRADATSTLSVTARQTRLGLWARREGMSGRCEVDFYGDSPENKNALMLRYAYVEIPVGNYMLEAGQTSDLISPLVPLTVNYSAAWGAGNTGYRRPQVKLLRRTEGYYYGISLARNITGDLDGDTIVDGEASAVPAVMGRVALNPGYLWHRGTLGLWSHYGRCNCPNKNIDYSNWSVGGDLTLKLHSNWKVLGELYTGSNMGAYGGAVYNSDIVHGVHSTGGWANLQYRMAPALTLSIGGGIDDVDGADLAGVADARVRNAVAFGAALYEISPGVKFGLELSRWATDYTNVSAGADASPSDIRLQWSIQGSF